QEFGRFRFVTKFTCVEPLLGLEHGGKTEFRFSVNTSEAIKLFEHGTPPLNARLQTAALVSAAGYPLGFLVAPIFLSPGWQEEYTTLFREMASILPTTISPTFELISHRFTARAKTNIASVFPASSLPMEEADRRYKYGQFGYGKYVYPLEDMKAATSYFTTLVEQYFPTGKVLYFV
ncbi:MAG: spore photoproduct lyase, partial [Firmicutes bacterium]|nr:spore photoproduct lyase [Bacillota bacterium]